jgi:hypothetical protein
MNIEAKRSVRDAGLIKEHFIVVATTFTPQGKVVDERMCFADTPRPS